MSIFYVVFYFFLVVIDIVGCRNKLFFFFVFDDRIKILFMFMCFCICFVCLGRLVVFLVL